MPISGNMPTKTTLLMLRIYLVLFGNRLKKSNQKSESTVPQFFGERGNTEPEPDRIRTTATALLCPQS